MARAVRRDGADERAQGEPRQLCQFVAADGTECARVCGYGCGGARLVVARGGRGPQVCVNVKGDLFAWRNSVICLANEVCYHERTSGMVVYE